MNPALTSIQSNLRIAVSMTGICLVLLFTGNSNAIAASADSVLVTGQYRKLITAENERDTLTIKKLLFLSPGTLLVAKTKTKEEGGWAGFWGSNTVLQHLTSMVTSGIFQIRPDFQKLKTVFIKPDVAEIYAPVQIAVSYAGQDPVPKPFVMVTIWIKIKNEWKMQSDIAIPVPQG